MSLFQASTCFEHHVLIVRRSKLYYTVSGIVAPIGGRPVHRSAHRQEAKIVLYSLWYRHTYWWPSRAQIERGLYLVHQVG
jgi:hypothetical protein